MEPPEKVEGTSERGRGSPGPHFENHTLRATCLLFRMFFPLNFLLLKLNVSMFKMSLFGLPPSLVRVPSSFLFCNILYHDLHLKYFNHLGNNYRASTIF